MRTGREGGNRGSKKSKILPCIIRSSRNQKGKKNYRKELKKLDIRNILAG